MLNVAKKAVATPFINCLFLQNCKMSTNPPHPNYLETAVSWAQEFPSCILEIDPLKLSCRMRMRQDGTNIIRILAKFSQRQNLQPVDFCPTGDYRSLTLHGEPPVKKWSPCQKKWSPSKNGAPRKKMEPVKPLHFGRRKREKRKRLFEMRIKINNRFYK